MNAIDIYGNSPASIASCLILLLIQALTLVYLKMEDGEEQCVVAVFALLLESFDIIAVVIHPVANFAGSTNINWMNAGMTMN